MRRKSGNGGELIFDQDMTNYPDERLTRAMISRYGVLVLIEHFVEYQFLSVELRSLTNIDY